MSERQRSVESESDPSSAAQDAAAHQPPSVRDANSQASAAVQRRMAAGSPGSDAQARQAASTSASDGSAARQTAAEGLQGTGGALPHGEAIGRSFGRFDVSNVRAHQGEAAQNASQALGASAYAADGQVAFRESPSLFTAAHEAAHVVQQRGGVQLRGGVGADGDEHEQHADQVAQAVVDGRSAEGLLGEKAGPGAAASAGAGAQGRGVQLDPDEHAGTALTHAQAAAAVRFNNAKHLAVPVWTQIAKIVGAANGQMNEGLVQKIAAFQKAKGLGTDGCAGDITIQWLSQEGGGEGLTDFIQREQITFLGMNPDSKGVELATLKKAAGANNVTGLTGSTKQDQVQVGGKWADLTSDQGIQTCLDSLPGLSPQKAAQIAQFLAASGDGAKDELWQMIAHLYGIEHGKGLLKRMVISGHSWGSSVWGDENGSIPFPHLERLTTIFPIAAGQVEDLMFSACNTGQLGKLEQYHRMFPNLKTIWGYAGYSPSAGTGSTRHIANWEKGSRGHDGGGVDKSREDVGKGSGPRDQNVAVWTDKTGYGTKSHYAEMSYEDIRPEVDALLPTYTKAFEQGEINKPQLDQLQTLLQNITGMHADRLGGELEKFKLMNARTLYLRHWPNITAHFSATHKAKIESGYRDAGVTLPVFAGAPRSQVLAQIKAFAPSATGGQAKEALKLLTEILRDLDPAQIPDTWN